MNRPGLSKKSHVYNFKGEWEEKYCFTEVLKHGICLLWYNSVTLEKYIMKGIFKKIKVISDKVTGPLMNQEDIRLVIYKPH